MLKSLILSWSYTGRILLEKFIFGLFNFLIGNGVKSIIVFDHNDEKNVTGRKTFLEL